MYYQPKTYAYRWASTVNNDVGEWVVSTDRDAILAMAAEAHKQCKTNPFMANMKIEVRGF